MSNREEITRMAREAGIVFDEQASPYYERFAALVAAAEREACAKVCEEEAVCYAQISVGCTDGRYDWKADGCEDCAAAIRARGQE